MHIAISIEASMVGTFAYSHICGNMVSIRNSLSHDNAKFKCGYRYSYVYTLII